MMVRIFVEGSTDEKFLTDLVKHRLLRSTLIPDDIFVKTGGWNGLFNEKNINQLRIGSDQDGVNLVIFDADGDFQERRQVLLEKARMNNVAFELFLFPNNQDAGDRETLLLQLVNPNTFLPVVHCFTPYFACLQQFNEQQRKINGATLKIPPKQEERKLSLINYLQFHGQETSERKRNYTDPDYWNLYNPALDALIQFLIPFFSE